MSGAWRVTWLRCRGAWECPAVRQALSTAQCTGVGFEGGGFWAETHPGWWQGCPAKASLARAHPPARACARSALHLSPPPFRRQLPRAAWLWAPATVILYGHMHTPSCERTCSHQYTQTHTLPLSLSISLKQTHTHARARAHVNDPPPPPTHTHTPKPTTRRCCQSSATPLTSRSATSATPALPPSWAPSRRAS
jgi:hypothetical protein